jgi:hypothetical protein
MIRHKIIESMNPFVLKRNYEFKIPLTASMDLINLKFTKLLNIFNCITGHDSDTISFKRKLIAPNETGAKKSDALSVFREGNVRIYIQDNKLKISWTVKLDNVYFLSFLISTFLVVFSWHFFNSHLFDLAIIATCGFLLTFFFGKTEIISKINEINDTCLDE